MGGGYEPQDWNYMKKDNQVGNQDYALDKHEVREQNTETSGLHSCLHLTPNSPSVIQLEAKKTGKSSRHNIVTDCQVLGLRSITSFQTALTEMYTNSKILSTLIKTDSGSMAGKGLRNKSRAWQRWVRKLSKEKAKTYNHQDIFLLSNLFSHLPSTSTLDFKI